jgi:uncharacterized membrane protein
MSAIISGKAQSATGSKKASKINLPSQDGDFDHPPGEPSEIRHDKSVSGFRISRSVTTIRAAPLPTVEEFAGYEAVHKGAAGEILSMAASAQKHQQWMDKHYLTYDFILRMSSNWLGALLLMCMLYWAYQAGMSGNNWLAWILLGSAGFSAVGILLRQRIQSEQKQEPPPQKQRKKS